MGRSLRDLVPTADRHKVAVLLEDTFGDPGAGICEVALLKADGAPLFVRIEAQSLEGRGECLAAVMDVTDRGRARAERDRLIEQLREALARVEKVGGEGES